MQHRFGVSIVNYSLLLFGTILEIEMTKTEILEKGRDKCKSFFEKLTARLIFAKLIK